MATSGLPQVEGWYAFTSGHTNTVPILRFTPTSFTFTRASRGREHRAEILSGTFGDAAITLFRPLRVFCESRLRPGGGPLLNPHVQPPPVSTCPVIRMLTLLKRLETARLTSISRENLVSVNESNQALNDTAMAKGFSILHDVWGGGTSSDVL